MAERFDDEREGAHALANAVQAGLLAADAALLALSETHNDRLAESAREQLMRFKGMAEALSLPKAGA